MKTQDKPKEQIEREVSAQYWLSKSEQWKKEDLQALREIHWQWYIHYLYYRGEHYSKFNTVTGKVVSPRKGVTINMVRPVVRAISNAVSKLQLKTTIFTDSLDEEIYKSTVNLGKYWDKKADKLELTKLYRKVVKLGCLTGAVPVRIVWKADANNGKGDLDIGVENPFLTLPDTSALSPREGNHLIRIVKRTLDDCRADPEYDQAAVKLLSPELKFSDSPIFDQVVQMGEKINQSAAQGDSKNGSVWVTELYVKELQEDKSIRIRKVCSAQNNVLYNDLTELEDFPIEWFMIEEDGISLMPEAWVKDIIPIVQAINKHETQIIEYIDKLPGGLIKPQGGRIKLGRLEDGMKVYEIDGTLVTKIDQLQLPPMPSALDNAIARLRRYIEDIASFTEVSRGIAPTGGTSGEYVKALMAGDSNNTVELKENLTDFATRLTKKALWNIAKYMNRADKQILEDKGEKQIITAFGAETPMAETFKLMAEEDRIASYGDVLAITGNNDIRIEIDSDITHTLQSKQEELMRLYELRDKDGFPIIPESTLLKAWGFGNVREVIEEVETERMRKSAMKMGMAQAQDQMVQQQAQAEMGVAPQGGEVPAEGEAPIDPAREFAMQGADRAAAAQAMMAQGRA